MTSFDIIIPVYNRPELSKRAIQSALDQSFPADKIIVIDDASPDPEVRQMLLSMSSLNSNIYVHFQEINSGIVASQNKGLSFSDSEFVAFLDCDDWLHKDALKWVASDLAKVNCDYLFTDRIEVNTDTNESKLVRYGGQPQLIGDLDFEDQLLDNMIASHLKVIRNSSLKSIDGFREGTDGVQDWDTALRLVGQFKFRYLPVAAYFHSVHPSQDSQKSKVINMKKTNEVRRSSQKQFLSNSSTENTFSRGIRLAETLKSSFPLWNSELLSTSSMFVLVGKNDWRWLPTTTSELEKLDTELIQEVLLLPGSPISKKFLKSIWKLSPQRPLVGVVSTPQRIDDLRWLNSYFDYIVVEESTCEIALIGFTHDDCKLIKI